MVTAEGEREREWGRLERIRLSRYDKEYRRLVQTNCQNI